MYDLPNTVDSFLELILKHQRYFAWFLFSFLILEITFSGSSYGRTQHVDEVIKITRKRINIFSFCQDFKAIIENYLKKFTHMELPVRNWNNAVKYKIAEFAYMILYYSIGGIAVITKSIKLYSWFSIVSMVGLLLQIFLSFLNR